jgi:hypothetical protein
MNAYLAILLCIYVFYVAFESLGSLARFGGFKIGFISVGVSLQNQILSLNRLLGFLIAPMVGFYADKGGTSSEIFFIGFAGSLVGGAALVIVYFRWVYFANFFARISNSLVVNGYTLRAFLLVPEGFSKIKKRELQRLKINFLLAQAFTTGLAMPSVFLLNIMAIKIPAYSSTFLQMTTVVSGIGNLVLNFYTAPLLSVEESRDGQQGIEDTHKSIFLGKVIGMLVISPVIMCLSFLI